MGGILADFARALAQLGDRRFRRVMTLGVLLALALLIAVYAGFLALVQNLTAEPIDIPLVGPVGGLETLLTWGSALFMLGLSVFLMVPVASAFTGLFLDDVAEAVEARHYPRLPPVPRASWGDALVESLNYAGVLLAANVLAIFAYAFAGPFIPLLFWGINGFLLGREYFTMAATRRFGRAEALAMRRRHPLTIWAAGTLMAAPLSVPLVNLAIPVLGAATFTHLAHRLARAG